MLSKTMSLIIVEDNPELCAGWEDIFSLDGHTVRTYQTGHAVLADTQAIEACDAMVSDYYLPDINGAELITRARHHRQGLPAIVLTGSKEPSIAERVRALDRVLLLYKPLSIDDLEQGLERLLTA